VSNDPQQESLLGWKMLIMRSSKAIEKGIWLNRLKEYFNVRLVIIEVRPGETWEDSWIRHLSDHPEAKYANIKIFNRTKYDQVTLNPGTGQISWCRTFFAKKVIHHDDESDRRKSPPHGGEKLLSASESRPHSRHPGKGRELPLLPGHFRLPGTRLLVEAGLP
jgi:hypothetical protein